MLKRRLRDLEDMFGAAMELPAAEREVFLAAHCAEDTALRRELKSLLEFADGAEGFVSSVIDDVRGRDRIGPYRIEREIGAGGMGTVYLAVRDDGEFHQRVAIKVARWEMGAGWAIQRFRSERQVLAHLAHPNIARLLDGGSTADGVPYLVMEYVEGQPLVTHCSERNLTIAERLVLFLRVCDAVACAHRNLVIHRDIKPANILVTTDGEPKLLDFGISKLLDPADTGDAHAACRTLPLMTPEYASPEQVRGEAVTTSTDVYSLGAVLYELLTEQRPYRIENSSPAEVQRAICDTAPPRPSAAGPRVLAGDLDNIVLKALHKDTVRRYSSVEQFAEDIRRYLAARPVIAREDTPAYRARKFVARHKTGVAAAVLLALTLLAGAAATAWQAKRVADQVFRAEKRFVQFRKLANAFLFDFQEKIQDLRDISEARQLVLRTGVEYIDTLAREAGDDPIFVREIARAYEKLGDVQGFRDDAALGKAADALASYSKAIALLEPLYRSGKADPPGLNILSRSLCSAGAMIERTSGAHESARAKYAKCLEVAVRVTEGRAHRRRYAELLTRAYHLLGDTELLSGNTAGALAYYGAMRQFLETHQSAIGPFGTVWLADTIRRIGRAYARRGDDAAALKSFQRAAAVLQSKKIPNHLNATRTVLAASQDLTAHARRMRLVQKQGPDPVALHSKTMQIARALAQSYPRHPCVREDVAGLGGSNSVNVQDFVLPLHRIPEGTPGK